MANVLNAFAENVRGRDQYFVRPRLRPRLTETETQTEKSWRPRWSYSQ